MCESEAVRRTCEQQLEELLGDPEFQKIIDLSTGEVMRLWCFPRAAARGFVLSAIGEPATMACIHRAWSQARHTGELGLAKLIVRRRVIDLLRKEARPARREPPPETVDGAMFDELVQRSPRARLELQQVIQRVRGALACFAAQGHAQQRQAQLLHRYALDEASYQELAVELASSEGALRVRVHKAMLALRRHIRECHPELEALLERRRSLYVAEGSQPLARAQLE